MANKKKIVSQPKLEDKKPTKRIREPRQDTIQYSFSLFDQTLAFPGDNNNANGDCIKTLLDTLKSYESMTWREINQDRNYNHAIPIDEIEKFARDHLKTINLDDIEDIFRFRITGAQRLWGIIYNNIFYPVWWDPYHLICPSAKKHT